MAMKWMWRGLPLLGTAVLSAVVLSGCPEDPANSGAEAPPGAAPGQMPPGGPGAPPPGDGMAPGGGPGGPGGDAAQNPAAPPPEGAVPGNPPPDGAPGPEGAAPGGPAPGGEGGAGGGEGGPRPGAMQLSKLPEDLQTQEKLQQSGKAVTIKGVLEGDACKGKTIRVDALQKSDGKTPILLATVLKRSDIGPFEMLVPKGDSPIWLLANCDVDGDQQIIPGTDLSAVYLKNPVTPSGPIDGVVMKFTKERITEGLPPGPGQMQGKGAEPPPAGGVEGQGAAPAGAPPAGAPPASGH